MFSAWKPWRFIAAIFLGFTLGFGTGIYVYANHLDKPEVVNQNEINQKIKGRGNSGGQELSTEGTVTVDESEQTNKWKLFNKKNNGNP